MPSPIDHAEAFVLLHEESVPDGMSGTHSEWVDAGDFMALLMLNSSVLSRIAEQDATKTLYTLWIDKSFELEEQAIIKRVADGQTFRVISDPFDQKTPNSSLMNYKVLSAEKYILPSEG